MSAPLTPEERARYEWHMLVPGVGEAGQLALKRASVLISRCGGLGGLVAYELAAAGVGRLILAHAGDVKPSDLNRQLLMTHDWIGRNRLESAQRRLKEFNPFVEIETVAQNICEANADALMARADIVVDCAPLFPERYAMNQAAVRQNKPMVECAMYELEAHVTTFQPGRTGCLRCLYPEPPPYWTRQFPVFGAVSGMAGCLGAVEVIKLITGVGEPLFNALLTCDLKSMAFRKLQIGRDPQCPVCGRKRR